MNGPLKEQMRNMIVCDSLSGCGVHLGLFCYNKRPSFPVSKTLREGIYDHWSFGGSVLGQIRGVHRNPLPVFQVPIVQNGLNAKVACLRVVYLLPLAIRYHMT